MVVIGCSKPEVSFSTHRRLPQQKTRLGFCYRMALRHAIRSIDLPERSRKGVGLNWDYGTLSFPQKEYTGTNRFLLLDLYIHTYIFRARPFLFTSKRYESGCIICWTPRCVSPVLLVPLACWVNIPPWEVASCSNIEAWGFSCFKSYFQYEGNTDASYSTCLQCMPLVVSGGQDLKQHSKFHHHPPGRWSNQLGGIAQEVGERAARLLPIGFWRRVILVNQKWEAYICNVVLVFTSVYVYLSTYEYI